MGHKKINKSENGGLATSQVPPRTFELGPSSSAILLLRLRLEHHRPASGIPPILFSVIIAPTSSLVLSSLSKVPSTKVHKAIDISYTEFP